MTTHNARSIARDGRISLTVLRARRAEMLLRLREKDAALADALDALIEIAEAARQYRDAAPVDEQASVARLWRTLERMEP